VYCCVLQCAAVCCVLQCAAESRLPCILCVAVCCSVLQSVAVLQRVARQRPLHNLQNTLWRVCHAPTNRVAVTGGLRFEHFANERERDQGEEKGAEGGGGEGLRKAVCLRTRGR